MQTQPLWLKLVLYCCIVDMENMLMSRLGWTGLVDGLTLEIRGMHRSLYGFASDEESVCCCPSASSQQRVSVIYATHCAL